MKSSVWLFAAAMCVSGVALAQTETKSGVTEITDPAKIAEIEQHAQQLQANPPAKAAMDQRDHKRAKVHRKSKASAKPAAKDKDKALPDQPVTPDGKG